VTGKTVAMKLCSVEKMERHKALLLDDKFGIRDDPIQEVQTMVTLAKNSQGHANVLALVDCTLSEDEKNLVVVTEYCNSGDAFSKLAAGNFTNTPAATDCFKQIAAGLGHLHQHNLAHLDISLENILLHDNTTYKICDFGLAVNAKEQNTKQIPPVGKTFYMAPELVAPDFQGDSYDPRVADMWSLGICLFMLTFGFHPYHEPSLDDRAFCTLVNQGVRGLITRYGEHIANHPDERTLRLLEMLLVPRHEERASIELVALYLEKHFFSVG
jgi:serine/threonine protein kinase